MNSKLIISILFLYNIIYSQNTVNYVEYSNELQQKDTIRNLHVLLEPHTIYSFSEIDFSAFKKLENVEFELSFFGDIVDENEQNIEFISINNPSFSQLKIKQLDWKVVNLSHTELKFSDCFENLLISKLIVHPFEGNVSFPVFTSKLKQLQSVEMLSNSDYTQTIDLTNLNVNQIQSLTVKCDVLEAKAEKLIYKFNRLKSLMIYAENTINASKFKNLEELAIYVTSEEQLQQIYKLKQLKKLTIILNYEFDESLKLNGMEQLQNLEFLKIKGIAIEIEEVCKLAENSNLKEVYVEDYYQINDISSCENWLKNIHFRKKNN